MQGRDRVLSFGQFLHQMQTYFILMKIDLKNKTYLVTGGSRGIGRAIVQRLIGCGANVAFTYNKNKAEADKLIASFGENNKNIFGIQADICDFGNASKLIDEIEEKFHPLDGLINNAGITIDKPFFKMDDVSWTSVVDTNLNGTYFITKAVITKLYRRDGGKIVNMASVSGMRGSAGQANYSATKAAIIAFTKTLAVEFARFNVQINSVAPGFIATDMVNQMDDNSKKAINGMIPMKRMGMPEEVADATLFLLSSSSNYITGHTLVIDGGLTA